MCVCLFFYEQDNVICYPDLVKVGIALDDGSVVRVEAAGYRMNHVVRDLASHPVFIPGAAVAFFPAHRAASALAGADPLPRGQ